jgi:NADPH-dependent curcumin reductase CurA
MPTDRSIRKDITVSFLLTLFVVVVLAAGLAAALLLGDLKRFLLAALFVVVLISAAGNATGSVRVQLARQITRNLPSAFR